MTSETIGTSETIAVGRSGPTIGFDLDMTLIDSRPGIAAVYQALSDETGVYIDVVAAVSRLGPPLDDELARWFPLDVVPAMADRYRALYPDLAIEAIPLLPGAADAIAAVRDAGGRVIVITAKFAANAAKHLAHLGIEADILVGWAWADGKRDALIEHGAAAYVGDHTADMAAARTASVLAVGVTSGPCDETELMAAGADVVLPDLRRFPEWLETTWARLPQSLG